MSEILIKAENIGLSYRQGLWRSTSHQAFQDVSLQLTEGQTLGVFGLNGCGKSSLLRVLAGILKPTTGKIWIRPDLRITLLSIGLGFRRELSGRDNALLSMMLQGLSRKHATERLEQIKEFSELGKFFDQPLKVYSSGMQSRLGFGTAMSVDLDVLMIDETLSVGDMEFKLKAAAALKAKMSEGMATVFVSHNAKQVEEICQEAIWLDNGRVVASGLSTEVRREYARKMRNG